MTRGSQHRGGDNEERFRAFNVPVNDGRAGSGAYGTSCEGDGIFARVICDEFCWSSFDEFSDMYFFANTLYYKIIIIIKVSICISYVLVFFTF